MDAKTIEIVQSTFAKVAPQAEPTAAAFYAKLFEIAPEVKPLFNGDMSEQGKKLMGTLSVVVNGLSNLEAVLPAAQKLAVQHVDYGVTSAQYGKVGEALLATLADGFGDGWTDEVAGAWTTAYTALAGVMIEAAEAAGGAKE